MFGDIDFLHGAFYPRCRLRVDKYFEDYCTLQFMVDGEVELSYDDDTFTLKGNWVWPCQPGTHVRFHVARHARSWPHRYVAFTGSRLHHWKLCGLWLKSPQEVAEPEYLIPLFDELLSRMQCKQKWDQQLAINSLERILLKLAQERDSTAASTRAPWLDHVLQHLDKAYSEISAPHNNALSYERLAAECGVSLSYLRACFREAVGVPLHTYVLQKRIAIARDLLSQTDLPLKAIAAQLGYSDVQFFSRQFSRFIGTSPSRFRNEHHRHD